PPPLLPARRSSDLSGPRSGCVPSSLRSAWLCPQRLSFSGRFRSGGFLQGELGARRPLVAGGDGLGGHAFGVQLLAVVLAGLAFVLAVDELVAPGAQVDLLLQGLAHEVALALELDEPGHRAGDDFRRVAALVLLEQL